MSSDLKSFTIDDNETLKCFRVSHIVTDPRFRHNTGKSEMKIYYGSGDKIQILIELTNFLKAYDKFVKY